MCRLQLQLYWVILQHRLEEKLADSRFPSDCQGCMTLMTTESSGCKSWMSQILNRPCFVCLSENKVQCFPVSHKDGVWEIHNINEMVLGKGASSSLDKTQVDFFFFSVYNCCIRAEQEPCKCEARALPLHSILSSSSLVLRQGLTKSLLLTLNSLCGSGRS